MLRRAVLVGTTRRHIPEDDILQKQNISLKRPNSPLIEVEEK
jgi:hypothetical protein